MGMGLCDLLVPGLLCCENGQPKPEQVFSIVHLELSLGEGGRGRGRKERERRKEERRRGREAGRRGQRTWGTCTYMSCNICMCT